MLKKNQISKRRWLLLPVETKARELTAKTLLACVAAERGWGAIVGKKETVRGKQEKLPRGTFIEKSISPGRLADIKKANEYGNRVSAWCEEGLLYLNREGYSQGRLEEQSYEAIDYFFAWGKQQADDVANSVGANHKIVLSGNPRFDLLRPELRSIFAQAANEIKQRYGKIILVTSRFSDVNINLNIPDFDYVSWLCSEGKITTKEQEALTRRFIQLNEKVFLCFQELIPVLSKTFSDHVIVIRPHPSENHEPWIEKTKNLPNVKVIYEGGINEWSLAADVVISNNCTTGVEAFLLDVPVISYRPIKDESVEFELVDKVSFQAGSEDEVQALVNRFVGNGNSVSREEHDRQKDYARKHIANIDGKLACETIMDYMDRLDLPSVGGQFPLSKNYTKIIGKKAKNLERKWKHLINNKHDNTIFYNQQKFPGVKLVEMQHLVDEFRRVTGRFLDLQIVQVEENTFCIFRP